MNKAIATVVISSLLSQLAYAIEESKYMTDETAKGNGTSMTVRASVQIEILNFATIAPPLGLVFFSIFTSAASPELNIKDLKSLNEPLQAALFQIMKGLNASLAGLDHSFAVTTESESSKMLDNISNVTFDGTTKATKITNETMQNIAISFASKIKEEKVAFYANGQVDVAQTPTLFRAASEVALVKGVDTNVAAAVIINNSEKFLEINNL